MNRLMGISLAWLVGTTVLFTPAWAVDVEAARSTVRIRILEEYTGTVIPAMVCITDDQGVVHLPPDGRAMDAPSSTEAFYRGVAFDSDPNWIGPVRKTAGLGDNDDRSYVYQEEPSIPYWREPVMYQASGDFTIALPEGTWRIAVEHGPEYVPVVKEIQVAGSGVSTETVRMHQWRDMPRRGWWSGDVHVHHPSEEESHREFLLHYAQAADLHLVNLLEMGHHEGTEFHQAGFGVHYRERRGDYWLVSGQEDPRSTFGHIIGLNLSGMVRDVGRYDFYDVAFDGIHEQHDALVGFAHFAWNGCDLPRGFPWYVTTEALDFIELMQFNTVNTTDYYDYLNLGFQLTAAAGSDTPWGSTIGEVRTYVYAGRPFHADAWFEGLGRGNTFVTNGPMLDFTVNGELPGEKIACEAGEVVRIKAFVHSHPKIGVLKKLVLVGNEGVLAEVENPRQKDALSLRLKRPIAHSQWVAVHAVCENGAQAHSTPVYLTVEERPTWDPVRGPAIVQRQLDAIDTIAKEFDATKGEREAGIHERLAQARTYYGEMLAAMEKDAVLREVE